MILAAAYILDRTPKSERGSHHSRLIITQNRRVLIRRSVVTGTALGTTSITSGAQMEANDPNSSLYFNENTNFLLSDVLLKPPSSFFSRKFKHHPSYGLLKTTPTLGLLPSYNIQSTSIVNINHFPSVINSCYSDSLAY